MRSPFLIALFHPLNVAMFGMSVVAGLIAAWWLFPVGILFWLAMVVAVARDPTLRINYQMQRRGSLARRFQRHFDRVERAQVGVFNSLSSAPASVRRALQPVMSEMSSLTAQTYALCQRMTTLDNYRMVTQSQSQTNAESDLEQLDAAIVGAQDPMVRHEYEESRRALQARLDRLDEVSMQLDRVEAQLLSLASEMDSMVAEVVRLQALGLQGVSRQVPDLVRRLREQSAQLTEFEQKLVEV